MDSCIANITACRADFPALQQKVHGKPLVYLDNAASTLKPQAVINAITNYYTYDHSNVHRGVHQLSQRASLAYDATREKVANFIDAAEADAVVFTSGTTQSINMVARSYVMPKLQPGDEILVDVMAHHSNLIPWQEICKATGAVLRIIPLNSAYEIDLMAYKKLLHEHTRFVALTHVSNVLGTLSPVEHMTRMAHAVGAEVLVDGAQAVLHDQVSVQQIDCEFYVFSAHKLYGPTGVGVCVVSERCKDECVPYETGGGMVLEVTAQTSSFQPLPALWEAGTPNIAGVIGLGAAIDYVSSLGMQNIAAWEQELTKYAMQKLKRIPGLKVYCPHNNKTGVFSFALEGLHPHDLATILDQHGIATRAGHHCAMPLITRFSVPALTRASIACYNTKEDIDALCSGLRAAIKLFARCV